MKYNSVFTGPIRLRTGKYLLIAVITTSLFVLSSCNSTTVLQANFNNDNIGSPPASVQAVGTVQLNNGSGSITVVSAPNASLPSNKWARISHPGAPTPETTLTGRFSQFLGIGQYGLICSLHIPSGAEVVTVQFETFFLNGSFMHLDFMPEGNVRIDDSNVRFGHFSRDRNFVLSVSLNITSTSGTAQISITGPGTSGSIATNIQPALLPLARQFGAVKFWVGFQHRATFFVDDILVTRKNS